jgi:hypothetical protein
MLGDLFAVEIDGHPVTVVCDANPVSGHGLSLTSDLLTLNYRPAFSCESLDLSRPRQNKGAAAMVNDDPAAEFALGGHEESAAI